MSQVQDTDIMDHQLSQGKFAPVVDEINNFSITVECENCSSIVQSNSELKKELDDALKQKKSIEKEYNAYVKSQTLLYNQLKQRYIHTLEQVIRILEEVCGSDNETDSSETEEIEN